MKRKEMKTFIVFGIVIILTITPIITANSISKMSTSESASDYDVVIVFKFKYNETKGPSAFVDRLDAPNFHNKKQDLSVKITLDYNIGTNPDEGHKFIVNWGADVYAGRQKRILFPEGGGRYHTESYRLGDDFKDGESGSISTDLSWNLNVQYLKSVDLRASCRLTWYKYKWNDSQQDWDLIFVTGSRHKDDMRSWDVILSKTNNNLLVNRLLDLPLYRRIIEKLPFLLRLL
jgi:hypothetical protein